MDTNGAIGDYDPGTGIVTIYANSMNFTYFHWLIAASLKIPASKLKVVPVAAGGSFGSKFFMHKVPTFAGFLSMLVGPAGEVRRGPDHAHRQQRPRRLRPLVRRRARLRRRRHLPRAADRLRRRLRRVPPVRHRHARQRALADRRAVPDPARRVRARTPCSRTRTSRAPTAASARRSATGCWSGSSTWRRATSDMDRVEIRRRNLIDARPVPVPHADREHLRQRQLPGRAREGARARRLRALGRRARQGARRGPPRRHRRRRLERAERLQLDRVLVLVRQAGVHADREPREREPADRPDRADRRHAALAVALGQQPGDGRVAGRRGGVRRRSRERRRHLRRLAARASRHRARAARATRSWSPARSPAPPPR